MKQNDVIKIVDSDGILWLNEKNVEEELYKIVRWLSFRL